MNEKSIARLKSERLKKKKTQKDVADFLGLTKQAVQRYESGLSTPKIETWQKLADYLGVPVAYLMGLQNSQYIDGDTNIFTNMDNSPNMMEQAKLADTEQAAIAFNRVLFWLDNEVLDENTSKPKKIEEVRQKEKELISLLKNTFETMREDFLSGINYTISEPQKYTDGIEYYKRNFIVMQEFNKLNEDDKLDLILSIKKLRQIELDQNKKASDD